MDHVFPDPKEIFCDFPSLPDNCLVQTRLFLVCKEQSSESGAQRPKLNLELHFGFWEELSKRRLASNITPTRIPVVTSLWSLR